MRQTIARFPKLTFLKVGGASKQSTVSGWGEHNVLIYVLFTHNTTRTQIRKLCRIVTSRVRNIFG